MPYLRRTMLQSVRYMLFAGVLLAMQAGAQRLPVIKATSKKVSINDGGFLNKDAWTLSPAARPDVYTADRTRQTKWVTFYTDIDSLRVKVKPGTRYNFVILLNGKDSCFTQIASAIPPVDKNEILAETHDTIPFTLTAFNAISVKAVINNTDTVNLHFDVGSFDFHLTKDAILKRTTLLPNRQDVLAGKAQANYNKLTEVQTLAMGNIVWRNPAVMPTAFTAHDMDGRFGWNLFENRVVEINYDNSTLVIHSQLPANIKGYAKAAIDFKRGFVCIDAAFKKNGQKLKGKFLLDTGSEQAIIADSSWAAANNFADGLKVIKTLILKDPRGVQYETKIVLAPEVEVNGFYKADIPTLVLSSKNPVGFDVNYFGNDFLKRFNILLDFKHDNIYLAPNKQTNAKYRQDA